jgi:hypothetical protein
MKHLLNKIFKLCLLDLIRLMNLQRKRLAKHLLDTNLNKVSRFGALLCYVYFFFTVRVLKMWKWPGALWTSNRPCKVLQIATTLNFHI